MASGGISIDMDNLIDGLRNIEKKVKTGSMLYATTAGTKMETYAKKNAPWTDRTSNSRQTIDHNEIMEGNKITIQLRGNTPHFKYLELAMEKRWAILWPTIQKHQAEILKGWSMVFN